MPPGRSGRGMTAHSLGGHVEVIIPRLQQPLEIRELHGLLLGAATAVPELHIHLGIVLQCKPQVWRSSGRVCCPTLCLPAHLSHACPPPASAIAEKGSSPHASTCSRLSTSLWLSSSSLGDGRL